MSKYMQRGDSYTHVPSCASICPDLPPRVFVAHERLGDFYLDLAPDFRPPAKVYGSLNDWADRILRTFRARQGSVGVLLHGEKGSGKSLLARLVSAKSKLPVIIISQPYAGATFNQFIQNIEQDAVVLFDEFEKTYSQDQQQELLSLLDGVYPSRKLYMFMTNGYLEEHLMNRPGRIHYRFDFNGVDDGAIEEYAAEHLPGAADGIKDVAHRFDIFSFDMLQALVWEMKQYGEPAHVAVTNLNIRPRSVEIYYRYELIRDSQVLAEGNLHLDPLTVRQFRINNPDDEDAYLTFKHEDLADMRGGAFTFKSGDFSVVLRPDARRELVWRDINAMGMSRANIAQSGNYLDA